MDVNNPTKKDVQEAAEALWTEHGLTGQGEARELLIYDLDLDEQLAHEICAGAPGFVHWITGRATNADEARDLHHMIIERVGRIEMAKAEARRMEARKLARVAWSANPAIVRSWIRDSYAATYVDWGRVDREALWLAVVEIEIDAHEQEGMIEDLIESLRNLSMAAERIG